MQTSPDAFVVIDYDDRVEWWNHTAETMFGWPLAQAAGRLLTDLVIPEEHKAAHDHGLRRRAAGGPARLGADPVQVEAVCRDGRRLLVELSVGELEWHDGPRFHAFIRDVTDREAEREALEFSENRARTAFENAPAGMLLADVTRGTLGRVLSANPAAARMLGYSREQLRDLTCHDLTHPDDVRLDEEHVSALLAGQVDAVQYEKRYLSQDGTEVWAETSASLVPAPNGSPALCILQLVDMSERRRSATRLAELNEELKTANRALATSNAELDSFAAAVAHDLQNPLAAIVLHAELMAESCTGPGPGLRAAEAIGRAATRLNSMVEGLLAYSRADGASLERSPVDLGDLVDDIVQELLFAHVPASHVTRDALPTLHLAVVPARQLLTNLLANALKYVAPGSTPRVHVSAALDVAAHSWTLCIADNGIGVPPGSRERVFAPFQRDVAASAYPGTGIGLATCRRIVERHGGRIWLDDSPFGGTAVMVELPAG